MDRFVNQINRTEPVTVGELRSSQGEELNEVIERIRTIEFSTYMCESCEYLQCFKNIQIIELFQLTEKELLRFLNHLKEITQFWRSHEKDDWGIEGLIIRECQCSQEITTLLCELISQSIMKKMKKFMWISRLYDKTSALGEKNWIHLCEAIHSFPDLHLEALSIPNNNIGERGSKGLVNLCTKGRLNDLTSLNLEGNHIGNTGFSDLLDAIQQSSIHSQLQELNVKNNGIGSRGVKMITSSLQQCCFSNLQILQIGYNTINGKWAGILFNTLRTHTIPQLQSLDCSGMKLGDEGMIGLVRMLREGTLPSLEELVLKECCLSEKELKHLSYCIQDGFCKNLRKLDLSSNHMKHKGIVIIRRMLCKQYLPHLEILILDNNRLGNQGIEELGNASHINCMTQVKKLHLSHNQITDEGASCIYLYIRNNQWKSVEQLFLDDNNFSKISVIHLRSLVEMKNKLRSIYLNEMTRHRDPYIHYKTQRSIEREELYEETKNDDEENAEYLREIFSISTDMIVPPCYLKRASTETEQEWTPINESITPLSDSVGLGVDNNVCSTPIA